jgi:hypothetical protein
MADALPANIRTTLIHRSTGNQTQHLAKIKASRGVSSAIVRAAAAKQYDEPSPQQARAIAKILRLPKQLNQ